MLVVTKLLDCMRIKEPYQAVFDHVQNPSIDCPEAVYRPSTDNVFTVYKQDSDRKDTCLRYVKPRRTGEITTYNGVRAVVSMVAMLGCIAISIHSDHVESILGAWVAFIAVLAAADPMDVVGRVLAPQSRVLFCTLVSIYLCGAYWNDRLLLIGCILSVLIIPTIWIRNKNWLMIHNWNMSPEVEKALRVDSDNRAVNSWVYGGRKQAYTVLHEIGFSYGINDLDGWAKPLYTLGYWNGCRYGMKVEGLEAEIKLWKSRAEELERSIEDMGCTSDIETRNEELERTIEAQNTYLKAIEGEYRRLKQEYDNYVDETRETLLRASERETNAIKSGFYVCEPRLNQESNGNIVQLGTDREGQNRNIVREVIECDLSMRKTAAKLNLKVWKVEHIRKAYRLLESGSSIQDVKNNTNLSDREIQEVVECIA